jgi:hypothetical protein
MTEMRRRLGKVVKSEGEDKEERDLGKEMRRGRERCIVKKTSRQFLVPHSILKRFMMAGDHPPAQIIFIFS